MYTSRDVETEDTVSTPSSFASDASVFLSLADVSIPSTKRSHLLVKQVGRKVSSTMKTYQSV